MRVKAMQQVIESQSSRIAALAAEKEVAALGHQDESTGQGEWLVCSLLPRLFPAFQHCMRKH